MPLVELNFFLFNFFALSNVPFFFQNKLKSWNVVFVLAYYTFLVIFSYMSLLTFFFLHGIADCVAGIWILMISDVRESYAYCFGGIERVDASCKRHVQTLDGRNIVATGWRELSGKVANFETASSNN